MGAEFQPASNTSITVIVHMPIARSKQARCEELLREALAHIDAHAELRGNIKYGVFRNMREEGDLTVVETFATKEVMEAWFTNPKNEEVNRRIYREGLMEGEADVRFYRRVGGTRD